MEQLILRYIEVIALVFVASGAVFFGFRQTQINKRLKELQDYVAVSIVPQSQRPGTHLGPPSLPGIQIMNVGKINLYLRKVEIGSTVHNFIDSRLISVGKDPFYFIPITSPISGQELNIKLYLTDEGGKKYLTEGKATANQVNIQILTNSGQTQSISVFNVIAWTHKTEKYYWIL